MEELIEYRKQLMDRLAAAAKEFRTACLAVKDPFAPIEAGWNVHQLAVHTRDTDKFVYGVRPAAPSMKIIPNFKTSMANRIWPRIMIRRSRFKPYWMISFQA